MGVDCRITLPPNVRLADVAKVMGIAAGLPWEKQFAGRLPDGLWFVHVPKVRVSSGCRGLESCANIEFVGETVDGVSGHHVLYHFEGKDGNRLMLPRSTAFWIAIARRLVDFYGGVIDYADCDDVYDDYAVPFKETALNSPKDGAEWEAHRDRVAAVKPITSDELEACKKFAAY